LSVVRKSKVRGAGSVRVVMVKPFVIKRNNKKATALGAPWLGGVRSLRTNAGGQQAHYEKEWIQRERTN